MINKNKMILRHVSEDTYIDNPFQWKPASDLLKIAKELTAAYNRKHSS